MAVVTKEKNARFSLLPVVKTLLKSLPFDAYLFMTVLSFLHVALPAPITSFTGVIGNANAFMAMLMIGVGFKLNGDSSQPGKIVRILAARYSLAIILALVFYFLLPFGIEYRQALTILALSPMSSALLHLQATWFGCGTGKRGQLHIRSNQHGADYRDTDDDIVGVWRNKTGYRGVGMTGRSGEEKIN